MPHKNPWDQTMRTIEQSMSDTSAYLDKLSEGVAPFDSSRASPEEARYFYEHPFELFEDIVAMHGTLGPDGMPLGEAQLNPMAAQRLFEQIGPIEYKKWIVEQEKRNAALA